MQVGGIGQGASPVKSPSSSGGGDRVAESIRTEIENTKQQLKSIMQSKTLSTEQKTMKQKELQQKISDLQTQLVEHQHAVAEERRKENAEKSEPAKSKPVEESQAVSVIPSEQASSIIEASHSLERAKRMDTVKISLEGRAKLVESSIERDTANGFTVLEGTRETLSDMKTGIAKLAQVTSQELRSAGESIGQVSEGDEASVQKKADNEESDEQAEEKVVREEQE